MTLVAPVARESLAAMQPLMDAVEQSMGFVPNSLLTMAHWPELLSRFAPFAGTVMGPGDVDVGLKQLVAFVASNAAGCRYCQAHTAHSAHARGVDQARIEAAFEFESSALFDDAERAALRVALHAGMVPNAVEPGHFAALAEHFDERQIVEVVAVIALFGFLNRWNDTLATSLEAEPKLFAQNRLGPLGWSPSKHE